MSFRVREANHYNVAFPHYKAPVKIGHFSTDSENQFCDDDHQMKYLSLPEELENLNIDLNEGYSQYVGVYKDDEHSYDTLLRWITSHKEEVRSLFSQVDSPKKEIDFICRRGLLTTINSTVYERFNDWSIYATKFGSVIYLSQIDTKEKQRREASWTEDEKRKISWGYKFEQCVTSDTVNSRPNTSHPVNVNEKYFVVMKSKFENHGLLFSGETDAVDPEYVVDDEKDSQSVSHFVEMKTNDILDCERKKINFRRKLLKGYLQCFIAGVPRLVFGFRNGKGIVKQVKVYNVSDLPRLVGGQWSPDPCLNFGSRFLSYVKQRVVRDDPRVVYKFYWRPGSSVVTCEELGPEYQFLPEWYIEEMSE